MFKYSHDLAQRTDRWRRETLSFGQIPLPPIEVINELFEIAYHASFLTEEKRGISFRLMCCTENEYSQLRLSGFVGEVDVYNPVIFTNKRNFNPKEIMRLAPATKFEQTLICVGYENLSSVESKYSLFIWGLLNVGSNWWDFIHGSKVTTRYMPASTLTVSSIKPGFLSISYSFMDVVILQDGVIFEPHHVFLSGPIYEYFTKVINYIINMLPKHSKDIKARVKREPEAFYFSILEKLLHIINSIGHGGSLLIVPHELKDSIINDSDLRIKFSVDYDLLLPLVIQAINYEIRKITLLDLFKNNDLNIERLERYDSINSIIEETTNSISNSVNFIGTLTSTDGAIIITDRFEVLGFGVEIMIKNKRLRTVTFTENEKGTKGERISIESFGTRHRSVFRFCNKYKDSISFIVSQDGGIKAIKYHNKKLICWRDIDLIGFQGT